MSVNVHGKRVTQKLRIGVCVVTYRRMAGLKKLLEHVAVDIACSTKQFDVRIFIVDNDATGSAEAILREFIQILPIDYCVEPKPGIAVARNRCMAMVVPWADAIVFVDDDEFPTPGWLNTLVDTWLRTGADAVTGPVIPVLPDDTPAWISKGKFFVRPRFDDGSELKVANTGNVLIDVRALTRAGLTFEENMSLTGGEDTLFFLRAARLGWRIVWSDRAAVYEDIPPSRATPGWIVRRRFRLGNSISICEVLVNGYLRAITHRVVKAAGNITVGFALLVPGFVWQGRAGAVNAICRIARGCGMIAGLVGVRYEEYRR